MVLALLIGLAQLGAALAEAGELATVQIAVQNATVSCCGQVLAAAFLHFLRLINKLLLGSSRKAPSHEDGWAFLFQKKEALLCAGINLYVRLGAFLVPRRCLE